jgi:hypothetical protein
VCVVGWHVISTHDFPILVPASHSPGFHVPLQLAQDRVRERPAADGGVVLLAVGLALGRVDLALEKRKLGWSASRQ